VQCVRAVSMVTPRNVPFAQAIAEHESAVKQKEVA
jgi:hypothetical protein